MNALTQRSTSFLLRMWNVRENDHMVCRYSLESSHTGEKWGFADLDALVAFLHQQTIVVTGTLLDEESNLDKL